MLSKPRQYRKELKQIRKLRAIGDAINEVGKEVFAIDPEGSTDNRTKFERLRAHELALLESMEADIPWMYKVIPTKL